MLSPSIYYPEITQCTYLTVGVTTLNILKLFTINNKRRTNWNWRWNNLFKKVIEDGITGKSVPKSKYWDTSKKFGQSRENLGTIIGKRQRSEWKFEDQSTLSHNTGTGVVSTSLFSKGKVLLHLYGIWRNSGILHLA